MARKLRLQFPGAIYHLVSRGNREEAIFHDDEDRESFLQTVGDVCQKTGWHIHAFCLLPTHFHLVLETPQPNLVSGMKWLLGTFTARFNRRHQLRGHLFSGRYRSTLISPSGDYVRAACDHVHLNPVRSNLVHPDSPLDSYGWSSLPRYFLPAEQRPSWLKTIRVLGEESQSHNDYSAKAREYRTRLERLRSEPTLSEAAELRRGWCFGDLDFRQTVLAKVEQAKRESHFGSELQEASEAKARRIIDEELRRLYWNESELIRQHKGDARKIAIAQRLRTETTVTLQWIAKQLHMGTKGHLSHLLYWQRQAELERQNPQRIRAPRSSTPNPLRRARLRAGTEQLAKTEETRPPVGRRAADAVLAEEQESQARKAGMDETTHQISIPLTDPFIFDPVYD